MKSYIQQIKRVHKRHFQLLEIMIAMMLILACAVPAIRIYMDMYKQESQTVRNYAADHVAHLIHAKIVEQMYKNHIPVDAIYGELEATVEDPDLGQQLKKIGFKANYSLTNVDKTKLKKDEFARYLCQVTIFLQDKHNSKNTKSYEYWHYAQVPPPSSETLEEVSGQPDPDADDIEIEKLGNDSDNKVPTPKSGGTVQ